MDRTRNVIQGKPLSKPPPDRQDYNQSHTVLNMNPLPFEPFHLQPHVYHLKKMSGDWVTYVKHIYVGNT